VWVKNQKDNIMTTTGYITSNREPKECTFKDQKGMRRPKRCGSRGGSKTAMSTISNLGGPTKRSSTSGGGRDTVYRPNS